MVMVEFHTLQRFRGTYGVLNLSDLDSHYTQLSFRSSQRTRQRRPHDDLGTPSHANLTLLLQQNATIVVKLRSVNSPSEQNYPRKPVAMQFFLITTSTPAP